MLEVPAKLIDVEGVGAAQSVPHSHLVVIVEVFVYFPDVFFIRECIGNAFVQVGLVALGGKQYGIGFQTISTGTTGFLKVSFRGIGHVYMNHQTYIGLVDTHAKGIGCDHYPVFSSQPTFLTQILRIVAQSGMVEGSRDLVIAQ